MIDYADKDRDGAINFEEFVNVVTKVYPKVWLIIHIIILINQVKTTSILNAIATNDLIEMYNLKRFHLKLSFNQILIYFQLDKI